MHPNLSIHDDPETDALYDTRPAAMAARFGGRTIEFLHLGLDVRTVARLAASYAFLADPSLRDQPTTLGENIFALGSALTAYVADRLVH